MIEAGVDEAGRGPIAGPVFAAAVILGKKHSIANLNDSKKISENDTQRLFRAICVKISTGKNLTYWHSIK